MKLFFVYAPGIARPHEVLAEEEDGAAADAIYAWGMTELPAGTSITSESPGDASCSSAT
ncbi:hypothetical protein [Stenotrophomonas sp. PS02298]|uniref:hypothetical protein n=1 Tax=Stenotrophomonas sp. PS02298 TaxID=2991424 RepID=UPI00249C13CD|nr:hypothetical protein [Stenotrophomonas sp. PS02298]